jgi:deoxyhypusine synthase
MSMTCRSSARPSPTASAGFGLVKHQVDAMKRGSLMTLDSIADFRELTDLKIAANTTGLLIIGGGVPKNFIQDTVVCARSPA